MDWNQLEPYLIEKSSTESSLLKEIRQATFQRTVQPYMISGEVQGRFLALISKLLKPQKILEVGAFTGYATLCLCEGLSSDGELIALEKDDELIEMLQGFIEKSPYHSQIRLLQGNAMEIIPTLDEKFDLIFLDADKENYPLYLKQLWPKLNKGGVLLADNVLWYGKVLEKPDNNDKATQAIQAFNDRMVQYSDAENVILPIRDGINMIRKK